MADFTYDGPSEAPAGRRLATVTNWAGAAISLALIAGVGVWGYKLVMRDVTGIPVVRAMEGPMRIAPEDPGGTLADHQGLAVNAVAGTGTAEPVPDRLLLAPTVTGLSVEDVPMAEAASALRNSDRARPAIVAPLDTPALSDEAGDAEEDGSDVDPIQALADQIAANAKPLTDLAPEAEEETGEEELAANVPAGALVRSLRPQRRPNALRETTLATSPEPVPESTGAREIDPADLPAGTRLAQLGAYDSPATARGEWDKFANRFGEYLEGKDRVIQRATSGGRVFYRLRAHGFADLSDARRFCAALVAENADCIPVTTR